MTVVALDYEPFPYQEDFHLSEARYNVIVGGRRVGKSKMALQELIKHCLETRNAMAWWVSPTIAMARDVGFLDFKEFYAEDLAPVITNMHESHMRIRFKNGSYLYFKGGDSEKSLRGSGLTYVVVDEAAFIDEEVWNRALMPALADKKGKALLISTPNGRNWFHRLADHAYNHPGEWSYRHWPSHINPLLTEETMNALAAGLDQTTFRQEFLAEFITSAGMVYDDFNEQNIIAADYPWNPHDFDLYLGMDFGYANPTAVGFFAVDRQMGNVIMFDELYVSKTSIDVIQDMVVQKLKSHHIGVDDVLKVYTDPAGNATELSSGISPVDSLRMGRYRFRVENRGTEIAPGLALVRSYVRAADGSRKFFITANCVEAIRSMFGYTYGKTNTETIKEEASKDGIHDHMCDAIRYFFVNKFNTVKWVAERPDIDSYHGTTTNKKMNLKHCDKCRGPFVSHTPQGTSPFLCRGCA